MGGFDNATWQALGLVLTLIGLAVSALLWSRRGPASGLRGVAWSLLPLAAGLTGVLRLGWEIVDSVLRWAARLIFSPTVWAGVALAGVSVVLFVVSGFLARRRGPERAPRKAARSKKQVGATRSAPAAQAPRPQGATAASTPAARGTAAGDDDMADIEAILRKHGIS